MTFFLKQGVFLYHQNGILKTIFDTDVPLLFLLHTQLISFLPVLNFSFVKIEKQQKLKVLLVLLHVPNGTLTKTLNK